MEITGILMVGQSNMAGRGDFGEVPPIENPRCHMLRNGRWQPMSEPINPDRAILSTFHSGIGLAASFADTVSKNADLDIGLIPCADGGTHIDQWVPGEVLFDNAVFCANLAKRSSSFGGIIWHQGESNCHIERADGYGEKLYTVLTELRRQTGGERVPLILGEIPHFITERWNITVDPSVINGIIHDVAKELPLCAVASSEGIPMKPDGIHFNSQGARIFGVRYAEAYLSLLGKCR